MNPNQSHRNPYSGYSSEDLEVAKLEGFAIGSLYTLEDVNNPDSNLNQLKSCVRECKKTDDDLVVCFDKCINKAANSITVENVLTTLDRYNNPDFSEKNLTEQLTKYIEKN